jgi:hypothetical protein
VQVTLSPFFNRAEPERPSVRELVDSQRRRKAEAIQRNREATLPLYAEFSDQDLRRCAAELGFPFTCREAAASRLRALGLEEGVVPAAAREVTVPVRARLGAEERRALDQQLHGAIVDSPFWAQMLLFSPVRIDLLLAHVQERVNGQGRRARVSRAYLEHYLREQGVMWRENPGEPNRGAWAQKIARGGQGGAKHFVESPTRNKRRA